MSIMPTTPGRDNDHEGATATPIHGGDTLLRPDPNEADATTALVHRIDALIGTHSHGRLVGPDGDEVEIPASVLEGFRRVAVAMAAGRAVTIAPQDMEMTTQQAADLLHISRPHLIKLLDEDVLPHHRTSEERGAHRRLKLKDVLEYQTTRQAKRRELLTELTQVSQEAEGGYS